MWKINGKENMTIWKVVGLSCSYGPHDKYTKHEFNVTHTPLQHTWSDLIYVLGNKKDFQRILDSWNAIPSTMFHYEVA